MFCLGFWNKKHKVESIMPKPIRKTFSLLEDQLANKERAITADGDSIRASISSLYELCTSLHSNDFQYKAKSIQTDKSRFVTVEQIWGQMNVLLAPTISKANENIEKLSAESVDDAAPQKGSSRNADEDEERLIDEELSQLQGKRTKEKKKKSTDEPADPDAWRYAFGKGNTEEDDEEDAQELENDVFGVDDEETASERRARVRDELAMADAEGEEVEEGGDDDLDDDKAALKELYGSDFSDDDARLGEVEEEEEEDPEGFEGEEGEEATFNEEEGKYWGDDDILDDPAQEYGNAPAADDAADEFENDPELNNPSLTEFERQRLIEKRRIEQMENERLYGTKWAMTGEVGGSKRPKDSLLDEHLDFEHAMKPVPVNTELSTLKLEERIKKRIQDKNFDDVRRRAARTTADDLNVARRDAGIDSEKSKLSLMDLYEKEYLDKMAKAEGPDAATAEALTEIEKDELRAIQMWKRLSQHLDALSNFYYTPKPVQQDLDARVRAVENQAPAISIENVGNFAVSRAAALAPQDVYRPSNHKQAGVSVDEMDPKEKRALRRAKKESFAHTKERKDKKAAVVKVRVDAKKAEKDAAKAALATKKKGKH